MTKWAQSYCQQHTAVPFDPSLGAAPFLGATQAEEPVAKKLRTAARLRSFLLVLDMHSTTSKPTSQTVEADTGIDFEALRRRVLTYSEFILCSYLIMIFHIILHIVLIYNICCISLHIILHHLFFSKTLFSKYDYNNYNSRIHSIIVQAAQRLNLGSWASFVLEATELELPLRGIGYGAEAEAEEERREVKLGKDTMECIGRSQFNAGSRPC